MRADNEERRPLLPRATSITSSSSHQNDNTSPSISSISSAETSPSPHVENVPIPYLRLFPIFLIRIAVPLTYSLIFPSIVPYLEHLKVPTGEIGLYAGIAEGSFMIVSAITAPIWGRLADRYGRKRCVIYGWLIGIVASALVGFGRGRRGVWWVIFWRGAAGINPTGVLARVLIAEISHPTNRARIFALYSPISSIGMMLGSLCGGGLAMPYGRLPAWLGGRSQILREWPFALPCLVGVGL
uniref:Major facilitator superfamily (MFS) profile domain-containing protein n=1 Tax=Kwoniella bestiolae CBS 10118 TaxID=1296100 RepID=A0A1B9G3N7_9TREE|nr:hypothetical protein I302_05422 [Kwoniella bestiolae CBS 10118]OCF25602.1 hypothetical protein I302_05422 [Kwoniella bestiolae CBS 10118]